MGEKSRVPLGMLGFDEDIVANFLLATNIEIIYGEERWGCMYDKNLNYTSS